MSYLVLEVDFLVYSVFSFKGETIKEERKLFFPTVTSTTPPFLDPVWAKHQPARFVTAQTLYYKIKHRDRKHRGPTSPDRHNEIT